MAIVVREDIVQGHRYSEDDRTGRLWRVFHVSGLTPSSKIAGDALYAVSEISAARVPRAGETHPTMPNFVCRAVDVTPMRGSRDSMWINCAYIKVKRRLLDMRVNGVSVPAADQLDDRGAVITVGYKLPTSGENAFATARATLTAPPPESRRDGDGWVYNKGQTTAAYSATTFEVVYMEENSQEFKAKKFMNCLNSQAWCGGQPREWMCRAITSVIDSPIPRNLADLSNQEVVTGGNALFYWITTYTFEKRPLPVVRNGLIQAGPPPWDELMIYTDPTTGDRPSDINPVLGGYPEQDAGNGWRRVKKLEAVNFADLDIATYV